MPERHLTDHYPRIRATDVDAASANLSGLYGDLRGEAPGPFEWVAWVADLGPVTFVPSSCDAQHRVAGVMHVHLLYLPRGDAVRVGNSRQVTDAAPGREAMVLSPGDRFDWTSGGRESGVQVRLAPSFLAAQLEALTGTAITAPIRFTLGLPTSAGMGAYVERLCGMIADEIDRGTPLDHPAVVTGLVESLACALLTGHDHDHAHLLDRPAPPSSRSVVRMVEEYVDAHAQEAISIADLAALTGASVRSLDAAFRLHRGTTPAGFVRARRLEQARRRLLADPRVSLAALTQDAGFIRPVTFAAAYLAAFGESVGETRRKGAIAASAPPPVEPHPALAARIASLTPREREVCVGVAGGMLNKQIAAHLGISERTVKEHRARAMAKLGAQSAAELGRLFR